MKINALFLSLFVAVLVSGCNFTLASDVTPPPGYQDQPIVGSQPETTAGPLYPVVAPDPILGKAIFVEKCAPCHGAAGLGDGPRSQDLPNPVTPIGSVEVGRTATPTEWYNIVTEGNLERFMPPFPSLNARQRWDVIAYTLKSFTQPAKFRARGGAL